ncbi:MAG: pyruvate, phosphate dikinase, partial [Pseudomonadota bacterium]
MGEQWIYEFGEGNADGDANMRALLGGKGANLAEMTNLQLPVPPGFTITTDVCREFYANDKTLPDGLESQITKAIKNLEKRSGHKFNDPKNPLLVSIRSGAQASMPGMMDTVLNLGISLATVDGLGAQANDMRFAYDTYRRFIQMYGNVVLDINHDCFEDALYNTKLSANVKNDTDLTARDLQELIVQYHNIVEDETGETFLDDPFQQLLLSVRAVFASWNAPRAITYRQLHDIPGNWGTAVNIQAMVFGNMGSDCATGVAFTRDPSTGENCFFGEYLINAQGEDVVAGIRTPCPLSEAARPATKEDVPSLEASMPDSFASLMEVRAILENHYRDMQDIEFTIETGKLYLLQTRNGKRSLNAALKIACDMVDEGLITKREAVMRIQPEQLDSLLHPLLDPDADKTVIAQGLPASPGAASGMVTFDAHSAELMSANGDPVILVRNETSPEDIGGMNAALGIVTARGGMTSHAAVVARGMGKPCVSGTTMLRIDFTKQCFNADGHTVHAGDWLTINGTSGQIMAGRIPTVKPTLSDDFQKLMRWADDARRMAVRTNAETPEEIRVALNFGAEGIGLCRTEHMFFDSQRIITMREIILAETTEARRKALAKIEPMQRLDFVDIFSAMRGFPVTIRLFDPPLHEFLPKSEDEVREMADAMEVP